VIGEIVHETPSKTFFIKREGKGLYRVYRNAGTAAIVCGTFHFKNDQAKAFTLAVREAGRREEALGARPAGGAP
jgi:hypothetical protein